MLPANQRFRADRLSCRIHLGLQEHAQLSRFDGLVQFAFDIKALFGDLVQRPLEEGGLAVAARLGMMQRGVGAAQDVQRRIFVPVREHRDAQTGGERDVLIPCLEWFVQRGMDLVGHVQGVMGCRLLLRGKVGEQDAELVARDACDDISLAHGMGQAFGHCLEQGVSQLLAAGVVEGLETVDIESDQCAEMAGAPRQTQRLCHAFQQQGAVGEAGERIVESQPVDLRLGLFFGSDVFLDRDKMGDAPVRLADRADDGVFGVFAAILALVVELALPDLAIAQGLPEIIVCSLRRLARMQHARILAKDFLAVVAGVANECFVDIFDVAREVGDDDAFRTLFHRQRELAQLLLVHLAGGDVQIDAREPDRFAGVVVLGATF